MAPARPPLGSGRRASRRRARAARNHRRRTPVRRRGSTRRSPPTVAATPKPRSNTSTPAQPFRPASRTGPADQRDWYAKWHRVLPHSSQRRWHGDITLGIGHDSNVNAGLASNTHLVTSPRRQHPPARWDSLAPAIRQFRPCRLTTEDGTRYRPGQPRSGRPDAQQQNDQGDYDSLDRRPAPCIANRPADGRRRARLAALPRWASGEFVRQGLLDTTSLPKEIIKMRFQFPLS